MANLFDIVDEYYQILNQLEENDGEITEELEQALIINKENLEVKLKGYVKFIRHKQGEIQILKDEMDRYKAKIQTLENVVENLKSKVKMAVDLFGDVDPDPSKLGRKLKYTGLSLWTVYTKPVLIEDEDEFEDERFTNYDVSLKLDKKKLEKLKELYPDAYAKKAIDKKGLKQILQEGVKVEGAELDLTQHHVMFK